MSMLELKKALGMVRDVSGSSDLRGRYFSNVEILNYEGVDFTGAVLYKCFPKGFKGALEIEPSKEAPGFKNKDFRKAEDKLKSVSLEGLDLQGVDLSNLDLEEISFKGANLSKSNFEDSLLGATDFENANLSGVDFRYANLKHSTFENANLLGADFTGSDLSGASFKRAKNMDKALMGNSLYDENTEFPLNLSLDQRKFMKYTGAEKSERESVLETFAYDGSEYDDSEYDDSEYDDSEYDDSEYGRDPFAEDEYGAYDDYDDDDWD